jgi:signal transduction histidine kinase
MDDPTASGEQAALLAGLVIAMLCVLVLLLFVVGLYLNLKTERDVNRILKAKIVGRLIQCD